MPVENSEYARRLSKLSSEALLVDVVYLKGKGFCLNFEDPVVLGEDQLEALKALKAQLENIDVAVKGVARQEAKDRWLRGVRSALELTSFVSSMIPSKDE